MNLSRQAKKFRALQPKDSEGPKPVADKKKKKKAQAEAPAASAPATAVESANAEPVAVPEVVVVQPTATQEPAQPKKPWVEKTKRQRFVREKTEKRERVTLPPLISSNKFTAKLLTRNVAPVPKDDADKTFR
jgi:hypothetical protein